MNDIPLKSHRLTFIREVPTDKRGRLILARCECGNEKVVVLGQYKRAQIKSCGCLERESRFGRQKTHGMSSTVEYRRWVQMIQRCTNPANRCYERYGGRGIQVCERWLTFENFFEDMGPFPDGMTLERKDNGGNYEPGNCIWATKQAQARNRRSSRRITFRGESLLLCEWAERLGIDADLISGRLARGWPIEDALTWPLTRKRRPKAKCN